MEIFTDAINTAWEIVAGSRFYSGLWTPSEALMYINTKELLTFIIIAPKEKRQGRPIERMCEVKAHANSLLCPVQAYKIYKEKVAHLPCYITHENTPSLKYNSLFRHIRDFSKPLSVDSISRIIKKVTSICVKEGSQIPKARAIGATLAASAGISADKIISHANWSGYSMFDNYYRLTRDSDVNITESIL
ncbi:hypothetical protein BB561_003975 [Smittium simulii]|uniref:Tyr recombinase domain-containing protein n=1 Tax=Smittium simulii TaxID=133385 RepID=A0A2T9YIP7_9FUNG|nr:hypothetical protein BB561_003975 [Smittium simulii]